MTDVPSVQDEHDAAGLLLGRTSFLNGVPHGDMVRYGAAGTPQLQAKLEHGVLSGPFRSFDAQGAPLHEAHYVGGKLHGVMTVYHDGCVAARRNYVLGVLHGESVSYAPSGLMASRMSFEAGLLEREALFMDDGVVVRRARYSRGKLEGETHDYARDGTLVQSSPYKANLLHGTVRRFDANGQVFEERRYLKGKPQGEWRSVDAATPGAASPGLAGNLEKWLRG